METLKKNIVIITSLFIFIGCNNKTTEECKEAIRAYEFGREMSNWKKLRGGGSLEKSITEFTTGMDVQYPYKASNPCVKCGYEDSENGIESPYNKDRKPWNTFE